MTRKTIYIAGPIGGMPDKNRKAFLDAEARLEQQGWQTVTPVDFTVVFGRNPSGGLLRATMAAELAAIPHLDAIYLLKGWEDSVGARQELAVAIQSNLKIILE